VPFTSADLDALDAAIKSGVKVVQFQDRRVEYQSVDDMLKLRSLIAADAASPTPGEAAGSLVRQIRMRTETGF